MAVEDMLALLWIISTVTIQITAREILFTVLDNDAPERLTVNHIKFGSNVTLACHCKNCSTIEFLKNGNVYYTRYFTGNLCLIDRNRRDINECLPHSARLSIQVYTNGSKWHCRGQRIQGEDSSRSSQGRQFIIELKNAKETSTDLMKTTATTAGQMTSSPGVPDPTENNQNTIITIAVVVSVLVVLMLVITVILCLKKRKHELVSRLNSTGPTYASEVKETPESRSSVCVMVDNVIYESHNDGNVNQDSPTETRKSLCIMEANPLYEST